MLIKTSEAIGFQLDWLVAKCEGVTLTEHIDGNYSWLEHEVTGNWVTYSPSTDWSQGGPIIERESIALNFLKNAEPSPIWMASLNGGYNYPSIPKYGPTPLVAAMRCFCASKLGDEVEIPEELK